VNQLGQAAYLFFEALQARVGESLLCLFALARAYRGQAILELSHLALVLARLHRQGHCGFLRFQRGPLPLARHAELRFVRVLVLQDAAARHRVRNAGQQWRGRGQRRRGRREGRGERGRH